MGEKTARRVKATKSGARETQKKRKASAPPTSEPIATDSAADNASPALDVKIAGLPNASSGELRALWRRLFGSDPPSLSRDLIARAIAYRLQERAFGGLSRANRRRLEEMAAQSKEEPSPPPQSAISLRPGTRLVREWHGRAYVVMVTDAGFDYGGSSYGSLTEIAKAITGAHWSGPRFFGLRSRKPAQTPLPDASSRGGPSLNSAIVVSNPMEGAHG
jgi:hypothetical protein